MSVLRIGSLFSGVGGLELGLERGLRATGHQAETVWQVEQSPFCRRVLARHWPAAQRFKDVRAVGHRNLSPVDILCGGFPCQDLSVANQSGKGLGGARSGLYFEMERIIRDLHPDIVVAENVHQSWRRWLPVVRRRLWALGYASVPFRVRAADVGARHRRSRVLLFAHLDGEGELQPCRPDRPEWRRTAHEAAQAAADAHSARLAEWQGVRGDDGPEQSSTERAGAAFGIVPWTGGRPAVPFVVRGVHGVPDRVDRIRALGNAVVPPVAEVIGRLIGQHLAQGAA